MEEWKTATLRHQISNLGNLRRVLKGGKFKAIKGSVLPNGYRYLRIIRNGKNVNLYVHHLVAKHFIGDRPPNLVIDHIDRVKLNNNVSNLRYITYTENNRNSSRYNHDIETQDKKKRRRIQQQRYYMRNRETILAKRKAVRIARQAVST